MDEILTFWGKAQPVTGAESDWHPLLYHALDVAAVAEALLAVRPLAARRVARLMALGEDEVRRLLVSMVALHDIGKFAPAFQVKAPHHWPDVLGPCVPQEVAPGRHTDDGYVLWYWQLERAAVQRLWPQAELVLRALAPGVFGHHGRPVGGGLPGSIPPTTQRFGRAATQAAMACAQALLELLAGDPILAAQPDEHDARRASWWVSGLVTVADWVGSSQAWFRYTSPLGGRGGLRDYWELAREHAARAVRLAGLVAPPSARRTAFGELTGIDGPSPAQAWAESVPLPPGPVLIVLEDVTGSGKTEAAQVLVHRLMTEGRASGAYWAMPTQATANAMYDRQAKMLFRLFAANADPRPSLILSHGQQRLHERFRASVLDGAADAPPVGQERDEDIEPSSTVACVSFLADDRRASLLADVGAGTVDQALLAVLPSKFNTVRLFGLADKVVVVDEAHAYDAYMGVEVQELLRFQAALGGNAVVLSATLSARQREQMARAWRDGVAGGRRQPAHVVGQGAVMSRAYPLATIVTAGGTREDAIAAAPWSRRSVSVRLVHDLDSAAAHVRRAVDKGGAAAWVRNTVDDCLSAAANLRAQGLEPIVFHARFAQTDRQRRESEILGAFGREVPPTRRAGQVVVATQVVEQSLDLDFDAMVSDVAPMDLLIQRAGRLQRHPQRDPSRPAGLARELVVLSPPANDDPDPEWLGGIFQGTLRVYEHAGILWRTIRTLARIGAINTPDGLRELIESVYESDDLPESLSAIAERADGRERADAAAATYSTLKVTDGYDASAHAWLDDLAAGRRVPRVRGDEPSSLETWRLSVWCSPRARG